MLGIGEHESLLTEAWTKIWKIIKIENWKKKKSQNVTVYSLHSPAPQECVSAWENLLYHEIHTVSYTVSLRHFLKYSNFREDSVLRQDSDLLLKWSRSCAPWNADAWVHRCVSSASSLGLTPPDRLRIVIMMLLFVLPAAFPHSCYFTLL